MEMHRTARARSPSLGASSKRTRRARMRLVSKRSSRALSSHEPIVGRHSDPSVQRWRFDAVMRASVGRSIAFAIVATYLGACGSIDQLPLGGAGAACSVELTKIDPVRLDMIVLLDQSGSMADMVSGGTKWSMVAYALDAFLNDPASAGIGVALQFF